MMYQMQLEKSNLSIPNPRLPHTPLPTHEAVYSDPNQPCALLFFGLMKEFESTVLPSIRQNILQYNSQCDVFLHTFNITHVPLNPRNSEFKNSTIDLSEAFSLTTKDHIIFESMDSFYEKRQHILNQTRKNYHRDWGSCCLSHDNMIKQWHSIQGVWDLMKQHEVEIWKQFGRTVNVPDHYYKQIGLFRSDVYYTTPIHIFDSNAATANFALHQGYNDRFFYGTYEYAQIWASKRFEFISTFEKSYMIPFSDVSGKQKDGYHSETYVKRLLDHYSVPVETKKICVWRVRSGPRIQVMDCQEIRLLDVVLIGVLIISVAVVLNSKFSGTKKQKLSLISTFKRSNDSPLMISGLIITGLKYIVIIWLLSLCGVVIYQMQIEKSHVSIPSMRLHVPLPAPDHKVSVVLMNDSRPRMIKESPGLMPTLLKHPSIDEILLLHANPNTAFKYVHSKVINIDATKENTRMGLSMRFYFCQLAKNDWVIHLDDDMEFTEQTLNEMLTEFAKNPHRIVGKYGRDQKDNSFFNGYSSKSTSRETDVVLTKFMVMERDICGAFFHYSHLIWEDVVLNNGDGPLWNGEDIFMSLVANHVYRREKNNYAMDWLDVRDAPNYLKDHKSGVVEMTEDFKGVRLFDYYWWLGLFSRNRHFAYRGSLWGIAKERLSAVRDNWDVISLQTKDLRQ